MTRDQIIQFVFQDPEKRLERFCKSVTSSQPSGDWEELQSIVLERLCAMNHDKVEDMWQHKDGYRSQALWIWLHTTAKIQAHGNRTTYQKVVLHPKEQFEDQDYFDTPTETEDLSDRIAFEDSIHAAHQRFEEKAQGFSRLLRVVLESYLRGNMNASHISRISGVPYNYLLTQLDEIRRVMFECAGIELPSRTTVTLRPVFRNRTFTRCPKLMRISQTHKKIHDVPYSHLLIGAFRARERKLYPQPTLFPIRQYLPPIYRKIAIA